MARKSKKRKKKKVNWVPIIWTLFIANVVMGLLFSPITSIRNVRVLGAQPHDQDRVRSLAQGLRGRPFGRVGVAKFESDLLQPRDVLTANLSHNLFGSAIVSLSYRRPVAVIGSNSHTYMDDQGVVFASAEPYPGLRQIELDPEYMQPGVALTLPWPSQDVASLCTKLNSFDQLKGAVVHLDTTGRLLISREDKHVVDLGGTQQIDEKLAKLKSILEDDPQLLDRVQSFSLADPARPASKPLKGNTN